MNLNILAAYNSLSLGQISYGITNSLFKRGLSPNIFPIHGNADIGAFDKNSDFFNPKFQESVNNRFKNYNPDCPSLAIWHINGSELKLSNKNYLLTFHETDAITHEERNILNSFEKIFVTSNYSKTVFEDGGVTKPVIFTPIGVEDSQYYKLNKKYLDESICVFSIIGKLEKRKRHKEAINGWIKKFGGNPKFRLHLFTHNRNLSPEQNNQLYADIFQGQKPPWNVVIFPPQDLNSQMNDAYNATSVVIDVSGGEALSLPSLNCVALGKYALIHNCTAMKDWANNDNSVLIESTGMEPVYDGIFFHPNQPFNQGNFFTFNEQDYLDGLEKVYQRWLKNPINESGLKLKEKYSFDSGVEIILNNI